MNTQKTAVELNGKVVTVVKSIAEREAELAVREAAWVAAHPEAPVEATTYKGRKLKLGYSGISKGKRFHVYKSAREDAYITMQYIPLSDMGEKPPKSIMSTLS